MKLFFALVFLAIIVSGLSGISHGNPSFAADNFGTVELDGIPEYLPYLAVPTRDYRISHLYYGNMGNPVTFINADDDPDLEIIRSSARYVMCNEYSSTDKTVRWQINLDPDFYVEPNEGSAFAISDSLDLGQNRPLIVINGSTKDGSRNRFWVVSPQTGSVLNSFELPGGKDNNGDERWDGAYSVLGAMDVPTDSGLKKALILICKVGFDLDKRGVFAVDPWTGETIWSYISGACFIPMEGRIIDLDGDGTKEVLVAANATANMGQRQINGFGDDKPHLVALGNNGILLWSRTLAEEPASCRLRIGDLDGDGQNEIVTALNCTYSLKGSLHVWNGQGELQASLTQDQHLSDCELIPSRKPRHLDLIFGGRSDSLFSAELNSGHLTIRKEGTNTQGLSLLGQVPLPGEAGQGLITLDREGQGRILDRDFNIVAAFKEDIPVFSRRVYNARKNHQASFLFLDSKLGTVVLKPNPDNALALAVKRFLTNTRWVLLSGLAMGLVLAWIFWSIARRKANHSRANNHPSLDNPSHLQERRLHLLEDLELSNHGAMAPLRSLRRLLWMLDAVHSGVGVNPTLVARLNEIWQDCHEDALPRLTNILERARLAEISDLVVNEALSSIERINAILGELKKANFAEKSVAKNLSQLHKEEKSTEAMLQSLRRQVAEHFQAPLSSVVEKVLRANQTVIEETGVEVQKGMMAVMTAGSSSPDMPNDSLVCRMDADELGFILDNLVGNACRAMSSAPNRKLRITWQTINSLVKIEVADTGIGIATEDHQKVLEPGYSSRPGGGLGLPKSQRLLRKYGGHLSVQSSEPGKGTTFSLVVPRS